MSSSVIFQTEPPSVKVHRLPSNAEFFTYELNDYLRIQAWMPDGFYTINQTQEKSTDEFYEEFCQGCHRNCYDYLERDEYDEVIWDNVPGGESNHCFVYENGYDGDDCPEGNSLEPQEVFFNIANMVFEISLNHNSPNFTKVTDTAFLQAGKVVGNTVYTTDSQLASNVFGTEEYPEHICWGYNSVPTSLRNMVTQYTSTPFNNDLLNLDAFERNCNYIREEVALGNYEMDLQLNYLCDNEYNALILVDAVNYIHSFFTLLTAGYKSIKDAPHIIVVPAKEAVIEKFGMTFKGYQTIPDAVGKSWFVSDDNKLVGQI